MRGVGVVGASGRAAAHSLARAGFSAWAVDQFADRDLKRLAACAICTHDYPIGIPTLAARFPPGPVLYTGGLENHPQVVAKLAEQRELWGNPPEVLARVRDPFTLFPALAEAGFTTPRLVPQGQRCPSEGPWLRKPLRSGGGTGIRFAQPGEAASHDHVFQEFIDGRSMSALFLSAPTETEPTWETKLIGVTEQLIGEQWLHSKPFAYCGNIGPTELLHSQEVQLEIHAQLLNERSRMRGAWGLDFVRQHEVDYPVEVNPRYTSAIEVLELAWNCSFVGAHGACFTEPDALAKYKRWRRYDSPLGKAIYYAPHTFRFPSSGPWDADLTGAFDPWRLPQFADIPEVGSVIEAGWPVLTFFETGSTPQVVRERLQSRAVELDRLFRDSRP